MGEESLEELAAELGIDDLDPLDDDVRIPTSANSAFLTNRAMGDWAEEKVHDLVNRTELVGVAYGDDDSMAAGDDGFEEMFRENRRELQRVGKRPDVLVFEADVAEDLGLPEDIRGLDEQEQDRIVPRAIAGLEVRSSKYRSMKYHQVKKTRAEATGDRQKLYQSFTPKVEDLPLVLKWTQRFGVDHYYVQTFFDEVHAIGFEDILKILSARADLDFRRRSELPDGIDGYDISLYRDVKVTKPRRSNFKKTHFIPVTFGTRWAYVEDWEDDKPRFNAETDETELGRLKAYVVPSGGTFALDGPNLQETLAGRPRQVQK